MNTHNYLIRVKDEHWEDIQKVKTLENCSANSIKYHLQKYLLLDALTIYAHLMVVNVHNHFYSNVLY